MDVELFKIVQIEKLESKGIKNKQLNIKILKTKNQKQAQNIADYYIRLNSALKKIEKVSNEILTNKEINFSWYFSNIDKIDMAERIKIFELVVKLKTINSETSLLELLKSENDSQNKTLNNKNKKPKKENKILSENYFPKQNRNTLKQGPVKKKVNNFKESENSFEDEWLTKNSIYRVLYVGIMPK